MRKKKTQVDWWPHEISTLRRLWNKSPLSEVHEKIPRHTLLGIKKRADSMRLKRTRNHRPKCSDPILIKLFEIIEKRNFTPNEVGEDVQLGGRTLRRWKVSEHGPTLKSLRNVLDYLELDLLLIESAPSGGHREIDIGRSAERPLVKEHCDVGLDWRAAISSNG